MIDPLTGMLISGGLGLAGDSLDALFGAEPVAGGSSITESLGMGGKTTTPYEASILAQEKMKSEIPGLMKQLNYNAMGQSGEAARQGADIALSNWQNTNQARNASAAMNQDASNLRGLGISQGQLAMRNNQAQAAKTRTSVAEMLARSGASPAAIAAASAKAMGDQQAANANTLQQSMQAQSSNLAQAGQMSGAANQVLQEDLKTQYNKVTPYLNQMQDLGSAMSNITNAGTAASNNLATSKQTMAGDTRALFEGTQALLGLAGKDFLKAGTYGLHFNEEPTKDNLASSLLKTGTNALGVPLPDTSGLTIPIVPPDFGDLTGALADVGKLPGLYNEGNMFDASMRPQDISGLATLAETLGLAPTQVKPHVPAAFGGQFGSGASNNQQAQNNIYPGYGVLAPQQTQQGWIGKLLGINF